MRSFQRTTSSRAQALNNGVFRASRSIIPRISCKAQKTAPEAPPKSVADKSRTGLGEFGDLLGPIGLTYSEGIKTKPATPEASAQSVADKSRAGLGEFGDLLGPIGLTYSEGIRAQRPQGSEPEKDEASTSGRPPSIHSMTTAEWRAIYEKDGTNDLWMEDEFNAGSRLMGGRAVHKGGQWGFRTGEGPSAGNVPVHKVKIFNHYDQQEYDLEVPEDRYILFEAEDKGLELPYACRMGCCTACAVKVTEGSVYQPEALGISQELKDMGYALMCVGFPTADAVMETVSEDEIYDLQFGRYFEAQALDPNANSILRDDYALSIANMDE